MSFIDFIYYQYTIKIKINPFEPIAHCQLITYQVKFIIINS